MKARCALCGNRHEQGDMAAVVGGGARWAELVCQRCARVIHDRTRNMAHGHSLLDGRRTLWRADVDEPGAVRVLGETQDGRPITA